MDPATVSLLVGVGGPFVLSILKDAFTHWVTAKAHNQTVQQVATGVANAAQAGAAAAIQAVAATGKVDPTTLKAAGATGVAAAMQSLPQVTVKDPTVVDDGK